MPNQLSEHLERLRRTFATQTTDIEGVKRSLSALDPETLLSISEEWSNEFEDATDAPRRGACVRNGAIRA